MAAHRDPVDRLVDLIVAVPVCSAIAARRSVLVLARSARRRLDAAVGRRAPAMPPPAETTDAGPIGSSHAAPLLPPPGDAPPVAEPDGADGLPIEGYDHLAARQVVDRLDALAQDELLAVERYERDHRHRRTVLGKIEQLTS